MTALPRLALASWHRIRFRLWVARLRFGLRRHGARLIVDAPHGASFEDAPAVKLFPDGEGGATTILRLGRDVRLGRQMTIELWARGSNLLEIGDVARFMNGVRIVLRSGSIEIGDEALVRDGAWLKSDGELTIGDTVVVGPRTSIHCTRSIAVGDRVGIAENVTMIDSDHTVDGSDRHYRDTPLKVTPVAIGDNVLVAAGAVLLRGAAIARNSVIGANAVVRAGEYKPGVVLAGNPAAVTRVLPNAEGAERV